ncbi:MAG: hypothetical protein IT385_27615 [Deltaproteobacteria bacterium]|nr:hypothetical protein [Deltaproteobacteria bacterium]
MASPDTKKSDPKIVAEVLATGKDEVKIDANANMSYADYARQRKEPIITVQQIISRKAEPEKKKSNLWPNMQIKQVVVWGELPKEEPPKPDRQAVTARSYMMHRSPPPKAPPKGIGSMEPQGK